MIIVCPQCATQYKVDAAKFPPAGRTVRCAKCGHSWHQDAPQAEPEPVYVPPPAAAEPEPTPPPRRAAFVAPEIRREPRIEPEERPAPVIAGPTSSPPRRSTGSRVGAAIGWLALVGLVLALGVTAVALRQTVVQAWPRSASVYAALGLKVDPVGIGFVDVTHRQETEDGQPVLSIKGKLVNLTGRRVAVPPIEVRLTDGGRHEVLRKSFAAGVAFLAPGQVTSFLARLSSPPAAARHMELRFAAQ